ncbi:C13 family peptidase [Marinobacterium sp. D7]|uniref:C13 family peptidase n=1 Tax=Marinobacterium ramblicola TaxID=2849041 RepID=UPI001C2D17A6|nr:C13 family peptidase [Marinobacterium ramblicola]MBV1789799.1 C13 family peptidase [Marinobacterium ramblicola]
MNERQVKRAQLQWLDDLGCNLRSGLGLVFWRRVRSDSLKVSLGQLITLALLLFALEFVVAFAQVDPPREFNLYGIDYLAASYLVQLLLILAASRLAGADNTRFGKILVGMTSALLPLMLVGQTVLWLMMRWQQSALAYWLYFGLIFGWQLFILLRLLRGLVGVRLRRGLATTLLYGAGTLAALWTLPNIDLWYTDYRQIERAENPLSRLDVEDIYYAQPQLMQEGLAALEPQRPGVVDLYLLAFGSYGPEDVFLNEVEYVREQFDRRYATEGRSLVLANNPGTLKHYPLASGHNLRTALESIGQRMDREEDVLFLFMTSHGSADHRFSVEMGPLRLDDLTAPELREALDEAGIRWRVILVSSCYSGGFVKTLESPQTLVITAAAADRTSFGCGSTSDFTYFGTAYFKQALMQEPRFIEAFALAREWVTKRELEDNFTPSNPQLFVGDAIAGKLETLYAQPMMQRALASAEAVEPTCSTDSGEESCRTEVQQDQ